MREFPPVIYFRVADWLWHMRPCNRYVNLSCHITVNENELPSNFMLILCYFVLPFPNFVLHSLTPISQIHVLKNRLFPNATVIFEPPSIAIYHNFVLILCYFVLPFPNFVLHPRSDYFADSRVVIKDGSRDFRFTMGLLARHFFRCHGLLFALYILLKLFVCIKMRVI